jgi:voltage-gated sodium channel
LLRLARIVRLVRFLPDARILLLTVVKSIPSLFSMVVLTILLLFVYGMVGWSLFGAALPESWGTIGRSMLTLFILLTLENFPTYLEEAEQISPYAVVFFVSYVLLAAFVVFNLLIGIVIGSMERAREHDAAEPEPEPEPDSDEAVLARLRTVQDELAALQSELGRRLGTGTGTHRGEAT